MRKRNVLNSPRLSELKNKRRRIFLAKTGLSLLATIILCAGLAYVSQISRFNISSVEISGNSVVDTEAIEKIATNEIAGKYLWLFPKTNIVLYPKSKMKMELASNYKRLKSIDIHLKENKVLEIIVSERDGKYLWCDAQEKCFFMDEDGFIFDEAPYISGEVYFKFYGPVDEKLPSLVLFKQTVEGMGLKPVGVSAEKNGDMKMFLSGKTKPEILFKAEADYQKVAENLQAALSVEPLKSDVKNKYSSLLYIDLRYGNKVYYKFR